LAPEISKGQSVVFNFTQPLGYQVQGWTGNLATLFTVNSANVTVDDLGIYNGSDTDYVPGTDSIEVGLYNITTSTQIGPTVTFAPSTPYTQQGYALFQTITPVTLTAGDLYEVDAVGYSSADPNGNSQGGTYSWGGDTLGGALSFPGSLPPAYANPAWGSPPALSVFDYSTTTTLDFPTGTNGGNPDGHSYEAGTLIATVPEGGASLLYLLMAGAACFGSIFFASSCRFAKPGIGLNPGHARVPCVVS
jgi:hypothetical protein